MTLRVRPHETEGPALRNSAARRDNAGDSAACDGVSFVAPFTGFPPLRVLSVFGTRPERSRCARSSRRFGQPSIVSPCAFTASTVAARPGPAHFSIHPDHDSTYDPRSDVGQSRHGCSRGSAGHPRGASRLGARASARRARWPGAGGELRRHEARARRGGLRSFDIRQPFPEEHNRRPGSGLPTCTLHPRSGPRQPAA